MSRKSLHRLQSARGVGHRTHGTVKTVLNFGRKLSQI